MSGDWQVEMVRPPTTVKVYVDTSNGTWGAAIDLAVFEVDGETLEAMESMSTVQLIELADRR